MEKITDTNKQPQYNLDQIRSDLKARVASNLILLMESNGISQKKLAKLVGIAEATISGYRNSKADNLPSIEFLMALKHYFGISIEDFLTKDLTTEDFDTSEQQETSIKLGNMHDKFTGIYTAYYLDTDSYKGRDDHNDQESLHFGCISINKITRYASQNTYKCVAVLGFSNKEEIEMIRKEFEALSNYDKISQYAEKNYPEKLYTGTFEIQENFAYISITHGTSDRALIILHSPTSNKSNYIGGIGTINSVSKGREKMPTVQFFAISRKTLAQSPEEIHQSLLLSYPTFKADKYAPELVNTFKSLYLDKNSVEFDLTESEKLVTVRANIERYIKESLTHNLFRYAKISNRDDDDFYHWISVSPDADPEISIEL